MTKGDTCTGIWSNCGLPPFRVPTDEEERLREELWRSDPNVLPDVYLRNGSDDDVQKEVDDDNNHEGLQYYDEEDDGLSRAELLRC